jgi:OOP family OmpA-OmpF porin
MTKHSHALFSMIISAVALAIPSAGMAQAQGTGFYLGAAFGQAKAEDFCEVSEPGFTLNSCDDKASAWKIFAGYRFTRYVAAEASYIQTEEFSQQLTFSGVPVTLDVDAKSYGIAALGIWPATQQFSLFGKLGIARTEAEAQGTVLGQTITAGEDETGLHYGVGLMFDFTRNLGLRAEWEKLDKGEFDMWSIGLQYRF